MKLTIILSMATLIFSATDTYDDILKKIEDYHFDADYESAFTYSQKILKIRPNDPFAHFYIAEYYGFEANFSKAYEHYTIAIENDVPYPLAYYMRAVTDLILNFDLGFCTDIKVVNQIIGEDPTYDYLKEHGSGSRLFIYCDLYEYIKTYDDSARELNYNGVILADKGFCEGAQLFFNQALNQDPKYDMAYYNLSLCSRGTEKEEEYLLKTIEINPKNDGAYRNLGQYYWEIGTEETKETALSYFRISANLGNEIVQEWLNDNGYSWNGAWPEATKLPQGIRL